MLLLGWAHRSHVPDTDRDSGWATASKTTTHTSGAIKMRFVDVFTSIGPEYGELSLIKNWDVDHLVNALHFDIKWLKSSGPIKLRSLTILDYSLSDSGDGWSIWQEIRFLWCEIYFDVL